MTLDPFLHNVGIYGEDLLKRESACLLISTPCGFPCTTKDHLRERCWIGFRGKTYSLRNMYLSQLFSGMWFDYCEYNTPCISIDILSSQS